MYLAFKDVAAILPEKQGIEENILFQTVCDQADILQPKGLFIPQHGELLEAIANGAVAAIWKQGESLPPYTPNHFPVFYTNDLAEAVKQILERYIEKLNGETDKKMKMTDFKFLNNKLLNKNNETYDIAVMLKKIRDYQLDDLGRRE